MPAADETGLKIIRGTVNTTPTASIVKGSGFTIARNGAGDITITFTSAFSDVPTVTAMPGAGGFHGAVSASTGGIAAGSVRLILFDTQTVGVPNTDGIIHFIAIGPK